jgi:hypothetical protein
MTSLRTLRASVTSDKVPYLPRMASMTSDAQALASCCASCRPYRRQQVVLVLTPEPGQDTERNPAFLGSASGDGGHDSATATAEHDCRRVRNLLTPYLSKTASAQMRRLAAELW